MISCLSRVGLGLLAAAAVAGYRIPPGYTAVSGVVAIADRVPRSSRALRDSEVQQPGSSQDPAQTPDAPPAPITDGPTLFKLRGCAQCHQIRGAGGHKGPDLSGVGRRLKPEAIHTQIANGGDAMPAFGEAIPAEEVDALTRFLHTLRDKTPKAHSEPPPSASAGASFITARPR